MNLENWPVNPGDVLVITILLFSALVAFFRGFTREALALLSWVVAGLAVYFLLPVTNVFLRDYLSDFIADVITGVVIFIIVLFTASLISYFLTRNIRKSAISGVDRSLGLVFGLFRGFILAALGYLLIAKIMPEADSRPAWIQQAATRPAVENGAELLADLFFDSLDAMDPQARESLSDGLNEGREAIEGQVIEQLHGDDILPHLTQPRPTVDIPEEQGYGDDQRDRMDQLIEGNNP